MLKNLYIIMLITAMVSFGCKDKKATSTIDEMEETAKISFVNDTVAKKVAVQIDGQLFTNYVYDGQTPKPILYPIRTKSGKTLTRGFPFEPRANERVDHPHHAGLWLNYGDVNGLDFWNNSYAIAPEEKHKYGTIHHQEISNLNEEDGVLTTKAVWRSNEGVDLLHEVTSFRFSEENNTRYIDRTTTLTAIAKVNFKDNKEGMIGIRVARELELPSDKPAVFTDSEGNATTVEALNNEGVAGDYLASGGLTGADVWGTRNNWVKLYGTMGEDPVSITIIDHPNNVGYPTYWHARGYGLFAANPLGQEIFSEGKEILNFELQASESTSFKYRIVIHNGSDLTKEQIELAVTDFIK